MKDMMKEMKGRKERERKKEKLLKDKNYESD